MRRLKLWLLIVGALALVVTGAAIAHGKRDKTHSDSAATTLAAAADVGIKNTTCTGQDGAYREFWSKASGTATGDPRLSGSLRLVAHGVINTTTDRGQVTGWLKVRGERNAAKARFVAVHRDGRLEGYVIGWVHDKTEGAAEDVSGGGRLLGTLTGSVAPNGAFTGKIGGNDPLMASARIQSGGCAHRDGHHWKRKTRR